MIVDGEKDLCYEEKTHGLIPTLHRQSPDDLNEADVYSFRRNLFKQRFETPGPFACQCACQCRNTAIHPDYFCDGPCDSVSCDSSLAIAPYVAVLAKRKVKK